jgi:hypothetical protein
MYTKGSLKAQYLNRKMKMRRCPIMSRKLPGGTPQCEYRRVVEAVALVMRSLKKHRLLLLKSRKRERKKNAIIKVVLQ